tara:strand:+ start:1122 stop:1466 length:345 start_codon:yes stop_codon:yes gene_type:complete
MSRTKKEIIKDKWKVNYFLMQKCSATEALNDLLEEGHKITIEDKIMKSMTLKEFIVFVGEQSAANLFGCQPSTIKAYRYGKRLPSINQAKIIMKNTGGRLNFESIYGPVDQIKN